MNDLLAQGSVMLGDLRDQREMIKGFRRKLVDIAGVLGMSGTVMRLIERRQVCSLNEFLSSWQIVNMKAMLDFQGSLATSD